ncbi:hypothetical protein PENSPDRAFT_704213 [Peniophora sp. CONT]|nr:hypothetical protein PENSPDRAFT_704213 [Peniophora sp. CONT]
MLFGDDITSLKILLLSTLDILGSMNADTYSTAIDHLLNDDGIPWRLQKVFEEPDSDTRVVTLKMVCLLMQRSYARPDMWQAKPDDSDHEFKIRRLLWTLFSYKHSEVSLPVVHTDIAVALSASLSLFHLRWLLLLQAGQVLSSADGIFSVTDFNSLYFSEDSERENWRWHLLYKHEMLEHPRALLLLLNSRLYDPLRSFGNHRANSGRDTSSCLVPLHDDACCRTIDGPLGHAAACAVLTMVANLIRAPDADREKILYDDLYSYGRLWNHTSSFAGWNDVFSMSETDRCRAPSKEFLSVLCDAGLDEWLSPSSDLTYWETRDTSIGRFLGMPANLGTLYVPDRFGDVLRTFAKHVDMSEVQLDFAESFGWLFQLSEDLQNTGPGEDGDPPLPSVEPTTSTRDVALITGATELDVSHSQGRAGSFELERVVIDTAVGHASSSHPSESFAVFGGRPGAYLSGTVDHDPNHGRGDGPVGAPKQPSAASVSVRERGSDEANETTSDPQVQAIETVSIDPARTDAGLGEGQPSATYDIMDHGKGNEPGGETPGPRPAMLQTIVDRAGQKQDRDVEGGSDEREGGRGIEKSESQGKGKGRAEDS